MKYFSLMLLILTMSCHSKKTLQLPEIVSAEVTEVLDVSPVYLFYDDTKPDSVDLNRANLISTTNWLVNVDKRLTLGQVIPKIITLQDKKRNAEIHKNENSKNYYTCNDTSIKNLGFVDFTSVIYKTKHILPNISTDYDNPDETSIIIDFKSADDIKLVRVFQDSVIKKSSLPHLKEDISGLSKNTSYEFFLTINGDLSFQNYITFKSALAQVDLPKMMINENEFIY